MLAQQPPTPQIPQEPPEEDPSFAPKEYSFNPVQAKREVVAGNFYFKKGNYSAAVTRFQEATRWDPGWAEAFLRLGESAEKGRDYAIARQAYTKYLELDKEAKDADAIRKRMAKWPKSSAPAQNKQAKPLDSVPRPTPIPLDHR